MRRLAEHVLELGHRDIGLLTMRLGRDWPHESTKPALADPDRVRSPAVASEVWARIWSTPLPVRKNSAGLGAPRSAMSTGLKSLVKKDIHVLSSIAMSSTPAGLPWMTPVT